MSNQDEQLKTLGKSLAKMQLEGERSFSENSRKSRSQIAVFSVGTLLLATGAFAALLFICPNSEWKDMSFIAILFQRLAVVLFLMTGLILLFFLKRKLYGTAIILPAIIIILMCFFFFGKIDLSENVFKYLFVLSMTAVGTAFLLKAFSKKPKQKSKAD